MTVTDKSYHGVTVDSRYTPIKNLLRYVEGSRWVVRYYGQALAKSNELSHQDTATSSIYQSYVCIDKLQLNVSQQLDGVQDPADGTFNIVGVGLCPPGVIPNIGDVFLADIGDGREGIFNITNATKQTHLKDALYELEYTLVGESSDTSERRRDLDSKTIQEYVYVDDYLTVGERPIITKAAFVQRVDLSQALEDIINQYFADFYSHEYATLLMPGQNGMRCYDAFLTTFVRDIVTTEENRQINFVDIPTVMVMPGMRQQTVWDALRRVSAPMVRAVVRRCGLLSSSYFKSQPQYGGAYYAGIQLVVYPLDPRTDVDADFGQCIPGPSGAVLAAGDVRRGDLQAYLDDRAVQGFTYTRNSADQLPYIVPVLTDDRYVFTEAFYAQQGPYSSQLERLTHQMLAQQPIDKALLLQLAVQATRWPDLERYYYSPVVMALLKTAIRTS